jgi:hypothetical protein
VPGKPHPVRWPERCMDDRPEAQDMWRDAMGHLVAIEREVRERSPQTATMVTKYGDLGHQIWRAH